VQLALALGRIDPDRGGTAANQGGVGLERLGHRLEFTAEFDQQPIAVVGVEEFIILEQVVDAGHGMRG